MSKKGSKLSLVQMGYNGQLYETLAAPLHAPPFKE